MSYTANSPVDQKQSNAPDAIQRPVMVYDGACSFCRFWVDRWRKGVAHEVEFIPFQQLPVLYFGITREQFSKSVYLITQYRRLQGAAAVFEVLAIGGNNFWNSIYYKIPFADTIFETGYRVVASYRNFFFRLTKIFYESARSYNSPPDHPDQIT